MAVYPDITAAGTGSAEARPGAPAPVSMQDAVGYPAIDCAHQASLENVLVLKQDRLFLLVDEHGNITPPGRCGLGLFHDDTRMLSHYVLRVGNVDPVLLSAHTTAPYHALVDLAVTDRAFGEGPWEPENVIHIRRELLLEDRLVERVTLTNFLPRAVDCRVTLALACDFADIFEVRGWRRSLRGEFFAPEVDDRSLGFTYRGRDGTLLRSRVRFLAAPPLLGPRGAEWRIRMDPGLPQVLQWEIGPDGTTPAGLGAPLQERATRLATAYDQWRSACARWRTDVAEFNTTLDQAVDDLQALYITVDETNGGKAGKGDAEPESVISAGIPWYTTAFGRDSIITGLQTLSLNPRIAADTLCYLARHQGTTEDPYTEEQPGKIMHELRRGELARTGEIPHLPYYGTVDATPLWLVLLHETWRWTGDATLVRGLLPNAERALAWIDRYGDVDGDGFVEYTRTSAKGLVNQGWKDSSDGVPYPDGRLPVPPIALVEVQGYVCDAKVRMAELYDAFGQPERAAALRREATALRTRIRERFWLEELGTFALALDGEKRPLPTITTNAGHLLWSRVPDAAQAARMAQLFASPAMFSGWGIRTLSAAHAVYNPMSYHNGSVWPHDNGLVVLGLSLYGHARSAVAVLQGLHDAAIQTRPHRLPELFCGIQRDGGRQPVHYPVSCSPQAWASGAFFMLLQAVLGLFPDAPRRMLHIRNPFLPPFVRQLTLAGFRIGASCIALEFRRHGDRTLANLLSLEGDPLQVHIELS